MIKRYLLTKYETYEHEAAKVLQSIDAETELWFYLRDAIHNKKEKDSLLLSQRLGFNRYAVDLALKFGQVDEAIAIAQREENPFRTRLHWHSIAKYFIDSGESMTKLFDLLKITDELKIDDILHMLPDDFSLDEQLRDRVCQVLDSYDGTFERMKASVEDSTLIIKNIKDDIEQFSQR